MHPVLEKVAQTLLDCWLYDVNVFKQPWLYKWVVPALLYFWFFLLKWTILTAPTWLPLVIIITVWRGVAAKETT